jgi:hypothetical protein
MSATQRQQSIIEQLETDRNNGTGKARTQSDVGRPTILITTEEHQVNDQAVAALSRDTTLYQRSGLLVRVAHDSRPVSKKIIRPCTPRIDPLVAALLREKLAAVARFVRIEDNTEVPAHPPTWCISAVHARADWPGIRHLEAVVDYPVLRDDGTILCTPGYDPTTSLLLETSAAMPMLTSQPTCKDARTAVAALLEVIVDFPIEADIHRSAWLAALLTPLARFAFVGPAPLFLVDANIRAAGKGLLLDCIARIVNGERFTVATYTDDENELRKRITSLALAGDRLVLFDNLDGKFGCAVLDAALTATNWEDRLLGVNRIVRAPLLMTWYATGNNVSIAADTARRVCHVRLESDIEHPEERQDFRHPNLLAWVGENRGRLLAAALTILRAYFVAGCPDQSLPAWESFEGWSQLVRGAIVWAGMPDPAATRIQLQERADVTAEGMASLLIAWQKMDPERCGLTAAEVVHRVFAKLGKDAEPQPDYYADLRDAIESLVGRGDSPALGRKLRSSRRRIFHGLYIDQVGKEHQANKWAVFPAEQFHRGGRNPPHTPPPPRGDGEDGEYREDNPSDWPPGKGDAWEGDT